MTTPDHVVRRFKPRLLLCALLGLAVCKAPQAAPIALTDALLTVQGSPSWFTLPSSTCTSFTATPTVVGDWLLIPGHDRGHGCTPTSKYGHSLLGYKISENRMYEIHSNVASETTPQYRPENNRIYWNTTWGSTARILDGSSLDLLVSIDAGASSDAAGVYWKNAFYFGTINTPEASCQDPVKKACGMVAAADDNGNVVKRIDIDQGFRSWIAAGLTTDGNALYVGGSPSHYGSLEPDNLYGCAVLKFDENLNILKSYDLGTKGCQHSGAGGDDEDAVAGETVLGPGSVWVQYHSANDAELNTHLVRLSRDLEELCKVPFSTNRTKPGAFYGAATVDKEGNAYFPITLPLREVNPGQAATLVKVTPQCQATTLASVANARANASPTLVDDQWVLFAYNGKLRQLSLTGETVREWTLGSTEEVNAAPFLHQGKLYVLQADGTLNIISDTGFSGYGNAHWPRYRKDNHGSATLVDGDQVVEYHSAQLDHYFLSAQLAEQAFVDAGGAGDWRRTGLSFKPGGTVAVCRFYGNTALNPATGQAYGPNSHFYTADAAECAYLKSLFDPGAPGWMFETNDFLTTPPVAGACASGTVPVYRAYNNGPGRGLASNHRYTTSISTYQDMLARGWSAEGVVMCAPQ
ncbi:hypothetical protein BURK2_01980 [Burkholderiales bacterium]|nr:hypothetical protein BURK2_01980 [Burkholderiales bacterium]